MSDKGLEYTQEQKENFSHLIREKLRERGWLQRDLATAARTQEPTIKMFIDRLSERTGHATFFQNILALDLPLMTVIRTLRLDRYVREEIEAGKGHLYPNYLAELRRLEGDTEITKESATDYLLRDIPAESRPAAKKAMLAVLESFK